MKRKSYGRDAGLSLRMLLTGTMLGLLYVIFAVVLFQYLNVGLIPMLVIVVGIAFFQYFTSDKVALLASGAKVVERDQAPELHAMVERLCAMADLPKPKVAVLDSVVTYFLSQILILAISRYREFAADRGSALITGAPEHLMSALQKISSEMFRIPQRDLREVESMNAFFIVPASVKERAASLFATHPPLEQRLERLSEIAREMGRPVG